MPFGEPEPTWTWQGKPVSMAVVDEIPVWTDDDKEWGSTDPCFGGHVCGRPLEYLDGVVEARCQRCNARVLLPSVPGGVTLMRAKALFEKFLRLRDEDSAKTSNPIQLANASGMLEELSDLIVALAHERVKLNEIDKLIGYTKKVVHQLESADD
jgi:hypothetical protein